jgi:hypothetical protein
MAMPLQCTLATSQYVPERSLHALPFACLSPNICSPSKTCARLLLRQVALKGARPMVKVYTDLQASTADVRSWYGVGLEPTIGLVGTPSLENPMIINHKCCQAMPHRRSSGQLLDCAISNACRFCCMQPGFVTCLAS